MTPIIDSHLICENPTCPKIISPTQTSSTPLLSSCCFTILCPHCFQHSFHQCPHQINIPLQPQSFLPCSSCNIRPALFHCLNCFNQNFCSTCSSNVHSLSKFAFHTLCPINSIKTVTINQNQIIKPLQELSQKSNLNSNQLYKISHQINPTQNQHKTQHNDQKFTKLLQLKHKLDTSQFSLNFTISQTKIQQFAVKENITKINKNIDLVFKTLLSKVQQKYDSVKSILNKITQTSTNQSLKQKLIMQAQNEVFNMKFLLEKNPNYNSYDQDFLDYLETKFQLLDQKIHSLNGISNPKDIWHLPKEFIDQISKITDEIQGLNIDFFTKSQHQSKLSKNEDCLINLRDRQKKKIPTHLNKSKNIELQTAKKTLNISQSTNINQDNHTHIKRNRRKVSIELDSIQSIKEFGNTQTKTRDLQRIKSFEFFQFTNSKKSLESINELKTQKKPRQKLLQSTLQSIKRRQQSRQELNLNCIRTKIQNPNSNEDQDDNFIKTSSQLVVSTQTLPTQMGITKPKPPLYPVLSPKGNTNLKQKPLNSNKTFSGSTNYLSNKTNISGFKSPNFKSKYLNELSLQPLESMHEFDSKALKKNISTRLISIIK